MASARAKTVRKRKVPEDPVRDYARAVKSGRIVAGRSVRLACERHLRDMRSRKRLGLVWDRERAMEAIDFFPRLLKLENESPFKLLPFQKFIIGSVFGWHTLDGNRRFRTAYIETGKGSGKTPLAAGVGLYGLVADGEPAPEIYAAAVTQDQARIVFKDAKRMVEMEPELSGLVTDQVSSLSIPSQSAVFRPVSSEHRALDGKRVHFGLIDELHEHPTGTVVNKIKAGTKRRQNALIFEITNSGWDRTSICWAHHDYSIRVLEGTADNESWFAYVAQLDEGDDWHNPKVWIKANPGLPKLPGIKYLTERVEEADGMPSEQQMIRRLNFCEWTESHQRWLNMDAWMDCGKVAVNPSELEGCIAGLDMASTADLSAFIMLFGPDDEGKCRTVCRFWIPEETLAATVSKRTEQDRLMLRQWVDAGHIIALPGDTIDYDLVEEQILEDIERFEVRELAFDRWGLSPLIKKLQDALGEDRVIAFPQTMASMSAPSKELEKMVADRSLLHGGNPVLGWMAANTVIRHGPDEQIKPDKKKSREKIDGIVSLVMAIGRMLAERLDGPSIYADRYAAGAEVIDAW
ncbi:MAG TPA: terminase TerL endonuclease subunit [Phycisphaerae bacterium]|nr:terminase TerL endonuclease subunit [Phycisphaerae bacterium]